jgi:hypothetical protein
LLISEAALLLTSEAALLLISEAALLLISEAEVYKPDWAIQNTGAQVHAQGPYLVHRAQAQLQLQL